MSTFPTNLNFSDTTPPAKPDAYLAEFQADAAVPDPNSPGHYVRNGSMSYRTPHVGGAFVLTDNYDLGGPDAGWTFVCNSASPFTVTHPAAIPVLPNPEGLWNFRIINLGAGTVTLDLNGLNLDGSGTNPTYATGEGAEISTDGTDLYTCLSSGSGGGSLTLAADTDVSITSPADRDLLIYHSSDSKWHNDTLVAADIPNIAESQVTGLLSDLAALAANLVIGFVINNGAAGTDVGPMLLAPRAGTISRCQIVTKASDAVTGLTFLIKQNGANIFSSNPTVAAATASGTTSSSTSLTSNPLPVAFNDVFTIDITSGSPNWLFTIQLET
jgi:hypothetical protein